MKKTTLPTELSGITVNCSYSVVGKVKELQPNPENPNKHNPAQIELLAKIIKETGWRNPIVVSKRSGLIVKGHGRYEAAKLLGVEEVPVDMQPYKDYATEIADLLADNRLADLSELDMALVEGLIKNLDGTDLDLTGFDSEAIKKMMAEVEIEDGAEGSDSSNRELSDVNGKVGEYRFEINREDYLKWQEELRQSVGFKPADIIAEIRRRLKI